MQKFATEENKSLWKHLSAMFDRVYGSCAAGMYVLWFCFL